METSVQFEASTEVSMNLFKYFDERFDGFPQLGSAMFEPRELSPKEWTILELGIGNDRFCS